MQTDAGKIPAPVFNLIGYLSYYGVKNAKNIALNQRAAIANDLLTYTKEYIGRSTFKKQYDELRINSRPQEPAQQPLRSIEQIQKDEIAKTEKSIKETEKSMKELSAEMAKSLQPLITMLQQTLREYQDPKNQYFSAIALGEKYQQEDAMERYKENTLRWEKDYPADIKIFIAGKLQKMLDYTRDIDYNAPLVEKYGKKRFVSPAYKGKGAEWKQVSGRVRK